MRINSVVQSIFLDSVKQIVYISETRENPRNVLYFFMSQWLQLAKLFIYA